MNNKVSPAFFIENACPEKWIRLWSIYINGGLNIVYDSDVINTVCGYIASYVGLWVQSRAYRPAEGGERACNSYTACIATEMLEVTKNRFQRAML